MKNIRTDQIDPVAISNVRLCQDDTEKSEEYKALCNNIEKKGVLQPILVRMLSNENSEQDTEKIRYGIIDGHLRFQAVQSLSKKYPKIKKWNKIPCVVVNAAIDDRMCGLILNFSKVDMSAFEKGKIIYELSQQQAKDVDGSPIPMQGKKKGEYKKISQKDIALQLGITPARVSQLLKFYEAEISKTDDSALYAPDKLPVSYFKMNEDSIILKDVKVEDDIIEAVSSIEKIVDADSALRACQEVKNAKKMLAVIEQELIHSELVQKIINNQKNNKRKTVLENRLHNKKKELEAIDDDAKHAKKRGIVQDKIRLIEKQIEELT